MNIQRTLYFGASSLRVLQLAALGGIATIAFSPLSLSAPNLDWSVTPASIYRQFHSDANVMQTKVQVIYDDQRSCMDKAGATTSGRPLAWIKGMRGIGEGSSGMAVTPLTQHSERTC